MTRFQGILLSSGAIPVFGSLGGITGGIGVDDDDELSVVELELAGVDDEELAEAGVEEDEDATLELARFDEDELAETGAEEDEDATDDEDEDEDEDEEAGAALLLLVLLLAGGATTVTAGLVTVFESKVTAVCAKALPVSVAPVFNTIAV